MGLKVVNNRIVKDVLTTILYCTVTKKIIGRYPDGYKVNGKIQPLGQIEPNILHLEYVLNPMPAYDMDTHRVETSFEVIGTTYAQAWQVIELTPQEIWMRGWHEPNFEIRIVAPKALVFDDMGVKMFAWFQLNGLPFHSKDKNTSYLYCNEILPEHQALVTTFEQQGVVIEIKNEQASR